jgi:hypothetical protein
VGRGKTAKEGSSSLTPKEWVFVTTFVTGGCKSPKQAAEAAGYKSPASSGQKLKGKPHVAAKIEELRKQVEASYMQKEAEAIAEGRLLSIEYLHAQTKRLIEEIPHDYTGNMANVRALEAGFKALEIGAWAGKRIQNPINPFLTQINNINGQPVPTANALPAAMYMPTHVRNLLGINDPACEAIDRKFADAERGASPADAGETASVEAGESDPVPGS